MGTPWSSSSLRPACDQGLMGNARAGRNEQRVALVTGSARGIGRAIADELAAAGHRLIGVDILGHGDGPFSSTHTVDLADADACKRLVAAVGPVDVLVNCAAVLIRQAVPDYTVEDFDRMNAVNLRVLPSLSGGC